MSSGCSCGTCRSFCEQKPGWLSPAQVAKIADDRGVSKRDLFERHLCLEAVMTKSPRGIRTHLVPLPAIRGRAAGRILEFDETGACAWLEDGRCTVHAVKPEECASIDHATPADARAEVRRAILQAWDGQRSALAALTGTKRLRPPRRVREKLRALLES